MLAGLAYVAVVAILLMSALGLSVWAGASIIYRIRDRRLEEMSPDPIENDVTPATVDYYPTGQSLPREYAVSKPLPMPKGAELEHLCFEQAKGNVEMMGQQVSDMIEEVQGKNFEDDDRLEREFFEFAKEKAESNDPKLYEQLKPDTEYTFDPNIVLWDLAREYQSLSPDDFNTHLRAICLVLKYFPRTDHYLQDPFYFQWQQMVQQRDQLGGKKHVLAGPSMDGSFCEIFNEPATTTPPMMVIKTADVSEETVAKVRKQFNEQAKSTWVEIPASKPKKSKKRQPKRSFAFEAAIKKPVRKRTRK